MSNSVVVDAVNAALNAPDSRMYESPVRSYRAEPETEYVDGKWSVTWAMECAIDLRGVIAARPWQGSPVARATDVTIQGGVQFRIDVDYESFVAAWRYEAEKERARE
jgi:hypothetical protein